MEGPAKYPSRSGNHIAESDRLSSGVTDQVYWPNAENCENARSFEERLPE